MRIRPDLKDTIFPNDKLDIDALLMLYFNEYKYSKTIFQEPRDIKRMMDLAIKHIKDKFMKQAVELALQRIPLNNILITVKEQALRYFKQPKQINVLLRKCYIRIQNIINR